MNRALMSFVAFTFVSANVPIAKAVDQKYYESFVEEKGNELIKIIMENIPIKTKFQTILDFANKNMDIEKMSKGALIGVYRLLPPTALSNEKKKRLEDKVVKYLCSTYVRLADDKASRCKNGHKLAIQKVDYKKNAVIVYATVALCDSTWRVNTYFIKGSKKPINITFDNVSILDKQAFVSLYREAKSSIDEFEKKLDNLIIN